MRRGLIHLLRLAWFYGASNLDEGQVSFIYSPVGLLPEAQIRERSLLAWLRDRLLDFVMSGVQLMALKENC